MSLKQHKPRRRKLYKGIRLETSGIDTNGYFQDFEVKDAMTAPVVWDSQNATLLFWNYTGNNSTNRQATLLFKRPGFLIRGPALIITEMETWYHWSMKGDEQTVMEKFEHLGFKGRYQVLRSGRWTDHSNFYNDNEKDFVLIKLAL